MYVARFPSQRDRRGGLDGKPEVATRRRNLDSAIVAYGVVRDRDRERVSVIERIRFVVVVSTTILVMAGHASASGVGAIDDGCSLHPSASDTDHAADRATRICVNEMAPGPTEDERIELPAIVFTAVPVETLPVSHSAQSPASGTATPSTVNRAYLGGLIPVGTHVENYRGTSHALAGLSMVVSYIYAVGVFAASSTTAYTPFCSGVAYTAWNLFPLIGPVVAAIGLSTATRDTRDITGSVVLSSTSCGTESAGRIDWAYALTNTTLQLAGFFGMLFLPARRVVVPGSRAWSSGSRLGSSIGIGIVGAATGALGLGAAVLASAALVTNGCSSHRGEQCVGAAALGALLGVPLGAIASIYLWRRTTRGIGAPESSARQSDVSLLPIIGPSDRLDGMSFGLIGRF